ncbi:MAG: hypothetical protein JWO40_344 [Candidatus Doudnabacteria bacterium]|nr:hypothetical protein [Candidatus Doudnabacteria bacterium]
MKTMTCNQLGGKCDVSITAATADEMMAKGMAHLGEAHPEMAADIKKMPEDDPIMKAWYAKFLADFAAAPEVA